MRKMFLAAAVLGVMMGTSVQLQATVIPLGSPQTAVQSDADSMIVHVRRGGGGGMGMRGGRGGGVAWRGNRGRGGGAAWRGNRGRGGGAAWRGNRGRGGVAWHNGRGRGGVAWRNGRGRGVAWRGGRRWRVGWVGGGYYYNPAFYNRYYSSSFGYCRLVTWNGGRVCRWYRRPWW